MRGWRSIALEERGSPSFNYYVVLIHFCFFWRAHTVDSKLDDQVNSGIVLRLLAKSTIG